MSRVANALLNAALFGAGLAVLVLLYGLATRTFTPRTAPVREATTAALEGDVIQVEVRNGAGEAGLRSEERRVGNKVDHEARRLAKRRLQRKIRQTTRNE